MSRRPHTLLDPVDDQEQFRNLILQLDILRKFFPKSYNDAVRGHIIWNESTYSFWKVKPNVWSDSLKDYDPCALDCEITSENFRNTIFSIYRIVSELDHAIREEFLQKETARIKKEYLCSAAAETRRSVAAQRARIKQ
jgi:hypothetical protein